MLKVKIAADPYTQERGLMWVDDLPEDHGMLFDFKRPQKLSFWGMNTFIPLDIAFVDDNKCIIKIASIQPHSLSSVGSDKLCPYAIETNAGYFKQNGIKVGDTIELSWTKSRTYTLSDGENWDGPVITFAKKDEGSSVNSKEDTGKGILPLKQSQVDPEGNQMPQVGKPGQNPVGDPVHPVGQNLPVLDTQDLSRILEDSYDQDENTQEPEAVEEQPQEPEETQEEQKPEEQYPVFNNVFEASDWAEKNSEVMRINYTTKHGRQLTRDVEPHGKFHSQSTNKEIMVTYDETIGDIRAFIVSNISSWAFPGRQFNKKFVVKG